MFFCSVFLSVFVVSFYSVFCSVFVVVSVVFFVLSFCSLLCSQSVFFVVFCVVFFCTQLVYFVINFVVSGNIVILYKYICVLNRYMYVFHHHHRSSWFITNLSMFWKEAYIFGSLIVDYRNILLTASEPLSLEEEYKIQCTCI